MTYTPPPRDPKARPIRINLLSDTQTRPTPAMREAMARAEVGDEQIGDDPSTNLLNERVAELLGAPPRLLGWRHGNQGPEPGGGARTPAQALRSGGREG